jgi:hypothetical protein
MEDQSNIQEQYVEKKGHATIRNYLPFLAEVSELLGKYRSHNKLFDPAILKMRALIMATYQQEY